MVNGYWRVIAGVKTKMRATNRRRPLAWRYRGEEITPSTIPRDFFDQGMNKIQSPFDLKPLKIGAVIVQDVAVGLSEEQLSTLPTTTHSDGGGGDCSICL